MIKSRFFLSCLLILYSEGIIAQNTFFKWQTTLHSEYTYSMIQLPDSSFLFSGYYQDQHASEPWAYLQQVDKEGNTIRSVVVNEDKRSYNSRSFFFNQSLYTIRNITFQENESSHSEEWICKIDTSDLTTNVVKKIVFPEERYASNQDILIVNDKIFIMYMYVIKLNNNYFNKGHFVLKLDTAFNIEKSYYDTSYLTVGGGYGLIHDINDNRIKAVVSIIFQPVTVLTFDENLTLLNTIYSPHYHTAFATSSGDGTYYLTTGVAPELNPYTPQNQIILTKKFSMQDELLDSAFYCNTSADTLSYSGFGKNTLVVDDKIFIAGTYNIDPSQWHYQQTPTWVELVIYDTSLNMFKKCYYGGDAFYECWSITKSLDNAVLIAGNRYDHNEPGYLYHPFILKVTTDGLLTANNNEPEKRAHDAIVFPNPGSEYLSVRSGPQIFGATFELFDLNGRLIKQEIISNQTTTISTTNLAAGTYVWRILYKNKEVESGKWVKSL